MNTAHRLYLGARNIGARVFSDQDRAVVDAILDEAFHGWTTTQAVGRWRGQTEETLVITFTSHGIKTATADADIDDTATPVATGPSATRPQNATLERCVRRLKDHLGQESVLLEQGGEVGLW